MDGGADASSLLMGLVVDCRCATMLIVLVVWDGEFKRWFYTVGETTFQEIHYLSDMSKCNLAWFAMSDITDSSRAKAIQKLNDIPSVLRIFSWGASTAKLAEQWRYLGSHNCSFSSWGDFNVEWNCQGDFVPPRSGRCIPWIGSLLSYCIILYFWDEIQGLVKHTRWPTTSYK